MERIETPREFDTDDYVQIKGEGERLFPVSGVIHDQERLFVMGSTGEVEIKFSDVIEQWQKVSSRAARDAAIRAEADKENAKLLDAAKAYKELCVCYRVGKQPAEKLFARLEKADAAICRKEVVG